MLNKFYKSVLCFCVLALGNCVFAHTLNSVELNPNTNKVIINADSLSAIKKSKISANEVRFELKNTNIADNMKTICDNSSQYDSISVMQNGNTAYINVNGINAANYDLVSATTGSLIPTHNGSNSTTFAITAIAALFLTFVANRNNKSKDEKREESLRKTLIEKSQLQQKVENEQKRIQELKTLRAKIQNSNNSSIHGIPTAYFSKNNNMTTPETLKYNHGKILKLSELKNVVNS